MNWHLISISLHLEVFSINVFGNYVSTDCIVYWIYFIIPQRKRVIIVSSWANRGNRIRLILVLLLVVFIVDDFIPLFDFIALFKIIYCSFVVLAVKLENAPIKKNIIYRKQVFHVITPGAYLSGLSSQVLIYWILIQIEAQIVLGAPPVFLLIPHAQLLLCLGTPQSS